MSNQTRAEWDAEKLNRDRLLGTHGFDPAITWRIANWRERAGKVLLQSVLWGVVLPLLLGGGLLVVGEVVDGISRHNSEYRRCLQHATNGLAIKDCH